MLNRVSVIVPVYNADKFLRRCLDSILAQSFTNYELILIDDGSTDDSGAICDRYAEMDNRVIVLHYLNQGVSAARNHGIDKASGIWVSFIDSDDYVKPDYLYNMVLSGERHNSDFVLTGQIKQWYNSNREDIRQWPNLVVGKDGIDLLYEKNILQRHRGPVIKLFKNKVIRNNNLRFNERLSRGEDALFVYEYLLHCNTISVASGADYVYCLREGSLMSQKPASYETERYGYNCMKSIMLQLIGRKDIHHPYPKQFLVYWFERVISSIYSNNYDFKTRIEYLSSLDYKYYRLWKKPVSWKESIMKNLLSRNQFKLYDWLTVHS